MATVHDDLRTTSKKIVLYYYICPWSKTPRTPKEAMAGHREAGYESQWTYHRGCSRPFNRSMQEVIREKKTAFKKWQQSNSPEDRQEYISAKCTSKRDVTRARSDRLSRLYDTLETTEELKLIYKLARARDKATQDSVKYLCVKDSQGTMLCNHASVREILRCYFKELINTQHPCSLPTELPPNIEFMAPITPNETRKADPG
nr:uncharacterized protein LOC116779427 [Danaus plexippus plexippus]